MWSLIFNDLHRSPARSLVLNGLGIKVLPGAVGIHCESRAKPAFAGDVIRWREGQRSHRRAKSLGSHWGLNSLLPYPAGNQNTKAAWMGGLVVFVSMIQDSKTEGVDVA